MSEPNVAATAPRLWKTSRAAKRAAWVGIGLVPVATLLHPENVHEVTWLYDHQAWGLLAGTMIAYLLGAALAWSVPVALICSARNFVVSRPFVQRFGPTARAVLCIIAAALTLCAAIALLIVAVFVANEFGGPDAANSVPFALMGGGWLIWFLWPPIGRLRRWLRSDDLKPAFTPPSPDADADATQDGAHDKVMQMRNDLRDRITLAVEDRPNKFSKIILLYAIFVLSALTVVGGVLFYVERSPKYAITSDVAARLSPSTQLVAERLVNEPCNRTLVSNLVSSLTETAEYSTIISFWKKTEEKCGPNDEIIIPVFKAQMRSSDFVHAEQSANRIIAEYPTDPTAYGWRAEAREANNNFIGAYSDMRTGLSLFLDPSNVALSVYYDVARLAAKIGNPCDAVLTLRDYIAFDPEKRRTQQLGTVMGDWQKKGACVGLTGIGRAAFRFDQNAPAIVLPVSVNGVLGRMIVDTGASRTTLSKQFAIRAGIEASDRGGANVQTPNGTIWVSGGRADFISLGDARLNGAPVFIQASSDKPFGEGVDGLLGLSFLGNFHVRINAGTLELSPL